MFSVTFWLQSPSSAWLFRNACRRSGATAGYPYADPCGAWGVRVSGGTLTETIYEFARRYGAHV